VAQARELPPEIAASVARQTADTILLLRQHDKILAQIPAIDPISQMNLDSGQAAAELLAIGEKIAADPARAADAAIVYRSVRQAFGSTPAAAVAAERLRQM
jgi:hypothetical protein